MAEKSTLVEKLPPIAKADSPVSSTPVSAQSAPAPAKPAATVSKASVPSKTTTTAVTKTPTVDNKAEDAVAVVAVETTPPPQITSTITQHVTYYSFLGDALIWGCMGLFLFGRAFKDKKKVSFVSMATYGGMLIGIGFMFFIYSKLYASYLRGEIGEPSLAFRGFSWMFFAPLLFYIISQVIKVPAQDKKLYITMFGLGSGIFLFIGLSQLVSGRMEQLGLSVFPFLFSASLTMLLLYTLGRGARAIKGKLKQSVSIIVYAIIGGWFLYPVINLLSHLTHSMTVYSLLLNVIDLALLSGITFGLWESVSTRTDRILFKPSFGKARRGSASPFVEVAVAENSALADMENPDLAATREGETEDGKPKPAFKRPNRPPNVSNN